MTAHGKISKEITYLDISHFLNEKQSENNFENYNDYVQWFSANGTYFSEIFMTDTW